MISSQLIAHLGDGVLIYSAIYRIGWANRVLRPCTPPFPRDFGSFGDGEAIPSSAVNFAL